MWARRAGVALRYAFAGEGRRLFYVFLLWLYECFTSHLFLALFCATVTFIAYTNVIARVAKDFFEKKFPYTIYILLFLFALYVMTFLSSTVANYLILSLTGFHPSQFPAAVAALQIMFILLVMLIAVVTISGLASITLGFFATDAGRVSIIAFMLSVVCFAFVAHQFLIAGVFPDLIEDTVVSTSFTFNKTANVILCPRQDDFDRVTPDSNHGYIVAIDRKRAKGDHGRKYAYLYRSQGDCLTGRPHSGAPGGQTAPP